MAQGRSNSPTRFNIRSVAAALALRGFSAVRFSVIQRPRFTRQVNACRPSVAVTVDTSQYQVSGSSTCAARVKTASGTGDIFCCSEAQVYRTGECMAQCGSHYGHSTISG